MSITLPVSVPERLNPLGPVRAVRSWLGNADGRLHRRASVNNNHAHIEVRGITGGERSLMIADLRSALTKLEGVDWAEIDGILGRVVVLFDPESLELDDLISVVEDVEGAHGTTKERFAHSTPDHPSDAEPIQRHTVALAADAVGFGVATVAQGFKLLRIPAEIPGVVSFVDTQPRVRRFLENQLGPPATDLTLASTAAIAQGLGQGPLGLVVDMARRSSLIAEQRSRRSAWQRREPDLVVGPKSVQHAGFHTTERPAPLPKGPIERYADRAAISSFGLVGLALAATWDPRRAADVVLAGVPKAATLGREVFAAHLDVALSAEDIMVMDPRALRLFDRADTLVIDARLVSTTRWSIDAIHLIDPQADDTTCALRTRELLDPSDPKASRRRRSWTLVPWTRDERAPRGTDALARQSARGGRRSLGLWRGDRLMAIVAVARDLTPLAQELVAEAKDSGLDVILAGGNDSMCDRLGDVARWTATHVEDEIRAHQDAGHVVAYVSGRAHGGLSACDIGIGVHTPGHRAPLGADLIIGVGLHQSWLILAAIRQARAVSDRSAILALAGATTGGTWAMIGPSRFAAQRTMLAINASALLTMANGAVAGSRLRATVPPATPSPHHWHELDAEDVLRLVGSVGTGLAEDEQVVRRQAETARPSRTPLTIGRATVDELGNPLTPLLVVGAALSAAVGSLTDAGLVMGVVGVNALVGGAQRVQTERAMLALESDGGGTVRALVEGVAVDIPAQAIVVGDVVLLEAGDAVPGDCRLLVATSLELDESSLTGESMPVAKSTAKVTNAAVAERTSMLFDGTVVASGEATAVVVAVGSDTEAGRSAAAAAEPPPSGVEQRLSRLTQITVPVTLGVGAAVTGLGFLRRRPAREAIGTGVSLMVAAVPEGLPALATVAQVASARRLVERNLLVRNPRAIEALGRIDQICFDKTGTLTEGRISLACVSNGLDESTVDDLSTVGRTVLEVARHATPAAQGHDSLPHATDRAVVAAAVAAGVDDPDTGWMRIDDLPFESRRSFHAVLGRRGRRRSIAMKGAPEIVLPMCSTWRHGGKDLALDPELLRQLEEHVESMCRRGLRVLAIAAADVAASAALNDSSDIPQLRLLGFVGLADLVRPAAAGAVATLTEAGVHVAMITGDHPSTAEAIAAELGMLNGDTVLVGTDLDDLEDDELDAVVADVAVFARVTPLQKVRVVAAFQRIGRSVAMTGDGANDAAAIRLADAGIAMGGRGTAAARQSADVIVMDDRIETIVDAVVEGRSMWESVRAAVAILVGGNLGELGFTLAGTALGSTAPLNPRQLLLVNLLTDMAPALAIAVREPPGRSPETLLQAGPDASLGSALTRDIAVRAGATAAGATGAWAVARVTGTPTRARTVGLAALVCTQLGQTLVVGGSSPLVLGATALSVGALVGVVQTPVVSQFFGCRPMGPVGWSIAMSSAAIATGSSVAMPWALAKVGDSITSASSAVPVDSDT